jgi:hypothetical protein
VIAQNSSLTFTNGTIVGAITNAVLSNGDTPLPVELTSFTAVVENGNASLQWQTASELNNYGFEIEKRSMESEPSSVDVWKKVGFVNGSGTSNTEHRYAYIDGSSVSGTFSYRLKQIDKDGRYQYSGEANVTILVPKVFALNQNFPNPFNPATTITFTLEQDGFTTLRIYDVLGKEVALLVSGEQKAGVVNTVTFNASSLSSGIYLSRLESNGCAQIKRIVLMK